MTYNTDSGVSKLCCKKGKTVSQISPTQIDLGAPIKALKARDVKNLLQEHYGPDWDSILSLQYYRNVLLSSTTDGIEHCECTEDSEDDSEFIAFWEYVGQNHVIVEHPDAEIIIKDHPTNPEIN